MRKDIKDVENFWNNNPLWTGESKFKPGTKEFFDEHRSVYINDCFGGSFDKRFLPPYHDKNIKILDLGCGIGFWTIEFFRRKFKNITSADLTKNALKITRKRLELYGYQGKTIVQNAESMTFNNKSFDHINCQGVIHHTPNINNTIKEIHRALVDDGTASLSVYYKNFAIRNWNILRFLAYPYIYLAAV